MKELAKRAQRLATALENNQLIYLLRYKVELADQLGDIQGEYVDPHEYSAQELLEMAKMELANAKK